MRTILLIIILCSFQSFTAFAEVNISDYKNYEITKTKFELEKISADLNSPWGMTFIDDENFLITEKTGKIFKLNI